MRASRAWKIAALATAPAEVAATLAPAAEAAFVAARARGRESALVCGAGARADRIGRGALRLGLLLLFFGAARYAVVFFNFLEHVADVEERVGIEADIDEGRLHAGQHAGDSTFIDAAD